MLKTSTIVSVHPSFNAAAATAAPKQKLEKLFSNILLCARVRGGSDGNGG